MKNNILVIFIALLIAVTPLLKSCNQPNSMMPKQYTTTLEFSPGEESKIIEAFLSLKDSSEIHLKEGLYKFENLSLSQLKHIQVRGDGPDKTILDFSMQTQGGEGSA